MISKKNTGNYSCRIIQYKKLAKIEIVKPKIKIKLQS